MSAVPSTLSTIITSAHPLVSLTIDVQPEFGWLLKRLNCQPRLSILNAGYQLNSVRYVGDDGACIRGVLREDEAGGADGNEGRKLGGSDEQLYREGGSSSEFDVKSSEAICWTNGLSLYTGGAGKASCTCTSTANVELLA